MAADQKEFEAMLAQAETRLRRLRSLYEQWFQGIERTEPTFYRTDLDKLINAMGRALPRNTALRFRYRQLVQRYRTYDTYWRRLSRQIEEGTYKRDVLRARSLRGQAEAQEEEAARAARQPLELDIDVDVDAAVSGALQEAQTAADGSPGAQLPSGITPFAMPTQGKSAPRPGAGASRSPAAKARSAGGGGNGLDDAQMRAIYQRYVAARRGNSEPVANVKYEVLAKRVRKMMPKLMAKHAGKKIDFETVVRDGKVALKPIVRK